MQGRIYDKGVEIQSSGKMWFLDIWKLESGKNVWRVECQIRRTWLKALKINCMDSLLHNRGCLWEIFTESYFRLCIPDDSNRSRRTYHPWWEAVVAVVEIFGRTASPPEKVRSGGAPVDWYFSMIGGCMMSMAVRLGLDDPDVAIEVLAEAMRKQWPAEKFKSKFQIDSIKLGLPVTSEGGANET